MNMYMLLYVFILVYKNEYTLAISLSLVCSCKGEQVLSLLMSTMIDAVLRINMVYSTHFWHLFLWNVIIYKYSSRIEQITRLSMNLFGQFISLVVNGHFILLWVRRSTETCLKFGYEYLPNYIDLIHQNYLSYFFLNKIRCGSNACSREKNVLSKYLMRKRKSSTWITISHHN
jgi:hypothetical protein